MLAAANILFLLTALPVVTAGPALAALYHVCLKSLRRDEEISVGREFWKGLVSNFRQALAVWLVFILLAAVMAGDIAITAGASGSIRILRYVFYCMGGAGLVLISFIYPVMAAFEDTLPHLLRNALFFASRNPFRALGVAALTVGPLIFTYMDLARLPLYAFLWAFFGFAGIAMLVSRLLIRDFNRFLPEAEGQGEEPV